MWTDEQYLLADIWQALTRSKKPHPARPALQRRKQQTAADPIRSKQLAAARARAVERRRQIEAGEIT